MSVTLWLLTFSNNSKIWILFLFMWHEEPTIIKWPTNLTVIWRLLLGACELLHIFVRENTVKFQLKLIGANLKNCHPLRVHLLPTPHEFKLTAYIDYGI